MPGHQGMFFLKKSFFKLNGYNSLLKFSGDLDLYLKFRRHMDISYHNEPIVSKFILGGVSNNIKYLLVRKMERFSVLLNNWKTLKISDIFCL